MGVGCSAGALGTFQSWVNFIHELYVWRQAKGMICSSAEFPKAWPVIQRCGGVLLRSVAADEKPSRRLSGVQVHPTPRFLCRGEVIDRLRSPYTATCKTYQDKWYVWPH